MLKKKEDSASIAIRIYYKLCSVLHEPFGFDATCIQDGFAGLCCVAFVLFVAIGRAARALTLILPFIKYRVGIQSGALLMDCKRSLIELRVGWVVALSSFLEKKPAICPSSAVAETKKNTASIAV